MSGSVRLGAGIILGGRGMFHVALVERKRHHRDGEPNDTWRFVDARTLWIPSDVSRSRSAVCRHDAWTRFVAGRQLHWVTLEWPVPEVSWAALEERILLGQMLEWAAAAGVIAGICEGGETRRAEVPVLECREHLTDNEMAAVYVAVIGGMQCTH